MAEGRIPPVLGDVRDAAFSMSSLNETDLAVLKFGRYCLFQWSFFFLIFRFASF